jgi:HSP20 family molecular chaperone IbpA
MQAYRRVQTRLPSRVIKITSTAAPNNNMATLFFAQPPRFQFARPEHNFRTLFRLLDEVEQCSAAQQRHHARQQAARRVPSFTPRFDLEETESTYELRGELPGVDKDQVEIAFSDPQTIIVRGKSERSFTSGTPAPAAAAPAVEATPEQANSAAPTTEESAAAATTESENSIEDSVLIEHEHASEGSSVKSYQATVEDEAEEGKTTPAATETPAPAAPATTEAAPQGSPKAAEPVTPKPRYWVSERSVGQFARSFRFPSRVEHEQVTASMNDGVLIVSVPKAKKHESRRIAIN